MTLLGHRGPIARALPLLRALVREPAAGDPRRTIHVVGHRGAARERPENTIPSFRLAIDRGADAVEADVCVTRDGRFLLWHDADPDSRDGLGRQTGIEQLHSVPVFPDVGSPWRRPVRELTLEEFRHHFGYRQRAASGREVGDGDPKARVPVATLEDLLELTREEPRLRFVYLDLKLEGSQAPAGAELIHALRRFTRRADGGRAAFHVLSPQQVVARTVLQETLSRPGETRLHAYFDFELPGVVRVARQFGARNVSMGGARLWAGFRQELGEALAERDAGRLDRVVAWTFNEPEQLAELVRLGVDAILTDDAPVLRGLLAERDRRAPARESSRTTPPPG